MKKVAYISFTAFLVIINLIFGRCAKEGMPTGGPRDTIPPQVKRYYPKPYTVNFQGKKVVFKFNEYIDLKDINKNFFSSPPFAKQPKFKLVGKKLIVKFRDTLRDSSTYILEFGNAIVDYTEGNALKNFKFVFSTYDKIDSFQVAGKVIDAYTLEPVPEVYVMLYKKTDDSVVYIEPPQYITITDENGEFQLFGIKQGKYKLFALKDLNFNFIYDGIDNQIGFSDTLLHPYKITKTIIDTLKAGTILHDSKTGKIIDTLKQDSIIKYTVTYYKPDNITIKLFVDKNRPQKLVAASRPNPYKVNLRFNYALHRNYFEISSPQLPKNSYFATHIPNSDSITIWITDTNYYHKDTLNFIVKYLTITFKGDKLQIDTATTIGIGQIPENLKLSLQNDKIAPEDSLILFANTPLRKVNSSQFLLYQIKDTNVTTPLNPTPKCYRIDKNIIYLTSKLPIDSIYLITVQDQPPAKTLILKNNLISIEIPDYIADYDTVNFKIAYWVNRFGTEELIYCSKKLTLTKQAITKIEWTDWNHIKLYFAKPIRDFVLSYSDFKPKDIKVHTQSVDLYFDQITDSITLEIKDLDFKNLSIEPIYFSQKLNLKYKWTQNKIQKYARPERGKIIIKFSQKIDSIISIIPLNTPKIKITKFHYNNDTLYIQLTNQILKRTKFLNLAINYIDYNWKTPIQLSDTITAQYQENQLINKTYKAQPVTLTAKISELSPQYVNIKANLQANQKYRLLMLPNSIQDFLYYTNDTIISFEFQTTASIKHNKLTLVFDTIPTNSWLILQLRDDKQNIIYTHTIKHPIERVTLNNIPEGTYQLYIIFDTNKNGMWDSGNYSEHLQPEPIIKAAKPIKIKSNWEVEETINLKHNK